MKIKHLFFSNQTEIYGILFRIGLLLLIIGTLWGSQLWETKAAGNPFDEYPGFGISPESVIRDDTIAYWEAFNREQNIGACMKRSGFSYLADVAFPSQAMQAVAESMGIAPDTSIQSASRAYLDPRLRNRDYVKTLSDGEQDKYYQTLYGENAQDIEMYSQTGVVASGTTKEFATSGCYGSTTKSQSSIWDGKRALADELQAMRIQITHSEDLKQTFSTCTQSIGGLTAASPAVIEDRIDYGGLSVETGEKILMKCGSEWENGYRMAWDTAMKDIIAQNPKIFAQIKQKYSGAISEIQENQEFRSYITRQLAVLSASPTVDNELDEQFYEIYFPIVTGGSPS